MKTYLIKFADGTAVVLDAADMATARTLAIELMQLNNAVASAIVSIERCQSEPL